jgi:hypothetical protein
MAFDVNDALMPYTNQTWTHFVLVYDKVKLYAYRNGVLVNSTSYSNGIYNNTQPFYIGLLNEGNPNYWKGYIDDVMIFNRSLSSSEINRIYLTQSPIGSVPSLGPTGFWKSIFDWIKNIFV